MAPFDVSAVTFIPSMEFIFGSLSFIADTDGRLHVSNLETTGTGRIGSDSASHLITRSASESDPNRLEQGITPPSYPFQFHNSANAYQLVLHQIMETQPEYEMDSGRQHSRVDDIIHPTDDDFRAVNAIQ